MAPRSKSPSRTAPFLTQAAQERSAGPRGYPSTSQRRRAAPAFDTGHAARDPRSGRPAPASREGVPEASGGPSHRGDGLALRDGPCSRLEPRLHPSSRASSDPHGQMGQHVTTKVGSATDGEIGGRDTEPPTRTHGGNLARRQGPRSLPPQACCPSPTSGAVSRKRRYPAPPCRRSSGARRAAPPTGARRAWGVAVHPKWSSRGRRQSPCKRRPGAWQQVAGGEPGERGPRRSGPR